jgi:predicted phage terminase large subunit-like protein
MLLLVPRGNFKSSLVTISGSIWLLINDPSTRILLVQQSGRKAEQTMSAISGKLLSGTFLHYFGDLVPTKRERWNQSDILLNREQIYPEASISARGVDSRIVGGHYNVIIPDDIIDLQEAQSEIQMESAFAFKQNMEPLFVNPKYGIELASGTRWGNGDLYERMIQSGQYEIMEAGWRVDERSAKWGFNEVGQPIFPERFDEQTVEQIRDRIANDFIFACQYDNRPFSDELMRFPPSCFQYYNWKEAGKSIIIGEEVVNLEPLPGFVTVDPSMGETKSADESAIIVTKVHPDGRIFIVEAWSSRINPIGLIERVFETVERWKPERVGIESVSYQKALQYFVRQEMVKRGRAFVIQELQTGGRSKQVRIEGLSPYFMNQQVFMDHTQRKLVKQLTDFPASMKSHDDLADALAYQVPFWRSRPESGPEDEIRRLDEDDYEVKRYGLSMGASY